MKLNSPLSTVISACAALSLAAPAAAVQLYYDPFLVGATPVAGEYAVGLLDATVDAAGSGQNPTIGPTAFLTGEWEAVGAGPNGSIQATSISYLGSFAPGGSQLSTPNSRPRRHLSTPLTAAASGTYYISTFVNFGQGDYSDGVQGNDMGYRAFELWRDDGEFLISIAYNTFNGGGGPAQQNPSTAKMYLDGFGYNILQRAPDSFVEDGSTHLIVVKLILGTTVLSDSISVFLDPKNNKEPILANALLTGIDVTLGAIGGMTIYGGSGTFPVVDELRIGTTYVDVLPHFPLAGDTNNDDHVDMTDYLAIFHHMNLSGQTTATGDVTGDGKVTIADYRLWKDNRTDVSTGAGSSESGVPEPGSLNLVTFAILLLIRHDRCRHFRVVFLCRP